MGWAGGASGTDDGLRLNTITLRIPELVEGLISYLAVKAGKHPFDRLRDTVEIEHAPHKKENPKCLLKKAQPFC